MLEKFTKPDVTHFERKTKGYSPRKKKMKTGPDERPQSGIGKQHKESLKKKMGLGQHFRKAFIDFATKMVKCTCEGY